MAVAALLCSTASAQPGATAVKTAMRTWTEAEVLQMAGLQPVQKAISWGRVVRYGGTAVVAGSLIYSALDWFYKVAQQSTGTPLDEAYLGPAAHVPAFVWTPSAFTDTRGNAEAQNHAEIYAATSSLCTPLSGGVFGRGPAFRYSSTSDNVTAGVWLSSGTINRARTFVWADYGSHAAIKAAARAHAEAAWADYLAVQCGPSGSQDLVQHLATTPASMGALRDQVLPGYLSNAESEAIWPYTYGQPYGVDAGISLDPAPNRNQWYDNPFANPSIDTDGDGFTDAEEAVAGTDPSNPDEYPTVSPWPAPEPGEEPWPDADGDGVPDEFDPCPFDAQNRCVDAGTETPDLELPDDYAREPTQQRVAAAVEGILDVLREDTGATPSFTPLAAPEPADTSALAAWVPDLSEAEAAWASYVQQVEADFADLLARTQTAFPFGMGAVLGNVPTFSGSECVAFDVTFMEVSAPVNLCSVPALDEFLATKGRSVLAAVLLLAFIWTSVHTVLRS